MVQAFPDYRWNLRHLLVDEPWVGAHFRDTGTHRGAFLGVPPTGRTIRTQEFAMYRFAGSRIVEVLVTADNLSLLDQLYERGPYPVRGPNGATELVEVYRPDMPWGRPPPNGDGWTSDEQLRQILDRLADDPG